MATQKPAGSNYMWQKPDAYNPYAAGAKRYGMGPTGPNVGPMSAKGSSGYMERDAESKARKAAMMNVLKRQYSGSAQPISYKTGTV